MTRELGSDMEGGEGVVLQGTDVRKLEVRLKERVLGTSSWDEKGAPGGKYLEKVAETTGVLPLWHFPPSCQKTFRAGVGAHCPGSLV